MSWQVDLERAVLHCSYEILRRTEIQVEFHRVLLAAYSRSYLDRRAETRPDL
ncbi:hypothetical protein JYU34_006994 [Plutella xylostella]|uniref:Uncharacterized protein n=1 Tax=Plutella xylostella TaxID=51655 RepID=A0ABQ7QTC6_PLUXY|nr:hypothetical protein JYU34_006994 [Plutella xylostella]